MTKHGLHDSVRTMMSRTDAMECFAYGETNSAQFDGTGSPVLDQSSGPPSLRGRRRLIQFNTRKIRLLVLALLALTCTGSARAQVSPPSPPAAPSPLSDTAKALLGTWEISDSERERKCLVTFKADSVPGGRRLDLDPTCAIGPLRASAAWTLGDRDMLRLVDGRGAVILELSEVENGMYEGERSGEGLYFMQSPAAAAIPPHTVAQMVGDWTFLRELDTPLCKLKLTNSAEGENYKLIVQPRCEAAIAGVGLTAWRLDNNELLLFGRNTTWRFGESDANVWERIPLGADALLLVRQ